MTRLPRAILRAAPTGDDAASSEPVAHWIAVLEREQRIAARTVRCRGDYAASAASTVALARALLPAADLPNGVLDYESLLRLDQVEAPLRDAGIVVHDEATDRLSVDRPAALAAAGAGDR